MSRFLPLLLVVLSFTTAAVARPTYNFSKKPAFLPPLSGLTDTIPPVINCPNSDTLILASGLCDTAYQYTVTAFDGLTELVPSLVSGPASGAPFPIGIEVVVYEATDTAGNTASCSFSVRVLPASTALSCHPMTEVFLGNSCVEVLHPADILVPPLNCLDSISGYAVQMDKTVPLGNGPWVPAVLGANDHNKTYMLRVTDPATGAKCFGELTVADTLAPVLSCPDITVPCVLPISQLSPEFLKDSLQIAAGMLGISDNCTATPAFFHIDVSTDLPCDTPGNVSGFIRRFWTATDAANNVATCVQRINRVRDLNNVLFPATATLSCADTSFLPTITGGPFIQFSGRSYTLLNAPFCDIESTYSDSIESLCGGSYRIFRRWAVADTCIADSLRVPVTGMQTIDVLDQDGPVWVCPSDTVVSVAGSDCSGILNLPDLISSDACSELMSASAFWNIGNGLDSLSATLDDFAGNDPASSDTLAVFGEIPDFPAGVHQVLYVATDVCGNTGSCVLTIRVWDGTAPMAVCDTLIKIFLDVQGNTTMPAEFPDNGSSDDCGSVYFKVRRADAGPCDLPGTAFSDFLSFCCADINDTIPVVLRVFDVEVPSGVVDSSFAPGQHSDCTVPVVVLDTNLPKCTAPANVSVECELFDPTLASYGEIIASCKVDSVVTQLSYTFFDTICNRGTITRVFRVFDTHSAASGQCTQRIVVDYHQSYYVRFPDDQIVTLCDTSDLYGEPIFFGVNCEFMGVSYEDERIYAVPDACFRIERTWKVVNWCTFDPSLSFVTVPNPNPNSTINHPDNLPGPVVSAPDAAAPWAPTVVKVNPTDPNPTDYSSFWTADINGFQYKQIIKIIDTEPPVIEDCPAAPLTFNDQSSNDVLLWNDNFSSTAGAPAQDLCESPVDLEITATDACYGDVVQVNYELFLDLNGDGIQETVVTSDNFPAAGTVIFNNALTPNYSGGDARVFDTHAANPALRFRFGLKTWSQGRKKHAKVIWEVVNAQGVEFPVHLPLGVHRIKWIVTDGCGGQTECEYGFSVDDPNNLCVPSEIAVKGIIKTPAGAPVADVAVTLSGSQPGVPTYNLFDLTDGQGYYEFSVTAGDSYTINAVRDNDPLNGVSTLDLLLINKHVLGLDPFDTPYKFIAADANSSRSVSTFDIVELRKLILGIYQQLPSNTSWRFIDAGYSFPNPANPFQSTFPETISMNDVQAGDEPVHHFTGIKVGDINGNVIPNIGPAQTEDRSLLPLRLDDRLMQPGETALVPLRFVDRVTLEGLQFGLQFDPAALEITELKPGTLLPPSGSLDPFYAQPGPGVLNFSWDDFSGVVSDPDAPVFYLKIKALQALELSSTLLLESNRLRPEAYLSGGELRTPVLDFSAAPIIAQTRIYPAAPNPSAGQTVSIPVALSAPTIVRLDVFDLNGRQEYSIETALPAGFQRVEIPNTAFGQTPGVHGYRIQAGAETSTGKLVRW